MSGDPGIDAKIKELPLLESWKKQSREYPDASWLSTLKPEIQAALEKEEALKDLAANVQSLHVQANNIRTHALRESRSLTTPIPTLSDWVKKAQSLTIAILNSNIEVSQLEVELFDEAIHMLEGGIGEPWKKEILTKNEASVTYKRLGNSWGKRIYGEKEWEKHEKESKEQIRILEVAKLWHQKLINIFRAAIQERKSHNREISKKIKSARKLCEEAEKVIGEIQKAERACQDSNYTDAKTIKEFVVSWKHLDELRTKFSTLRGSGVEFQDFGHPEPIFPSTAGLIALESDAARKGRIFGIFEKSQQER